MVARDQGRESEWGVTVNGCGVPVQSDEYVLEIGSDDERTALNILKATEQHILKR